MGGENGGGPRVGALRDGVCYCPEVQVEVTPLCPPGWRCYPEPGPRQGRLRLLQGFTAGWVLGSAVYWVAMLV